MLFVNYKSACSWFYFTTGVILSSTAFLKFLSAGSGVKYLELPDPVFGFLTVHQLIIGAAVIESSVAYFLFWSKDDIVKMVLTVCLSTCFLIYRLGMHWINPVTPCPCLGRATDWMHIQPSTADTAMKYTLAYLLIGSYAIIFAYCLKGRRKIARNH